MADHAPHDGQESAEIFEVKGRIQRVNRHASAGFFVGHVDGGVAYKFCLVALGLACSLGLVRGDSVTSY